MPTTNVDVTTDWAPIEHGPTSSPGSISAGNNLIEIFVGTSAPSSADSGFKCYRSDPFYYSMASGESLYVKTSSPAGSDVAIVNSTPIVFDTSVEVDDFLIALDAAGGVGGLVDIAGDNPAHSTASDAAIASLEAKGWTVARNDYFISSNQVSALNTTTIKITLTTGKNAVIRWGDGNTTSIAGTSTLQTYNYNYSAMGSYGIDITGDLLNMTQFRATGQPWVEGDLSASGISALQSLTTLYMYSTQIDGDISGLSSITSLANLRLYDTGISGDIAGVSSLVNLDFLYLYITNVSGDISSLSSLPAIRYLRVDITNVTGDVSAFSGLTTLLQLYAAQTSVSGNISSISSLVNLTHLFLYNTSVTGDLSSVSALTNMLQMQLYNTSVSGNLSSLSGMSSLSNLHLSNTSVAGDISSVPNKTSFTYLNLSDTSCAGNISSLSTFSSVSSLFLQRSSVSGDLQSIGGLSTAASIYLYDTSVSSYTSTTLSAWSGSTVRIENLGLTATDVDNFIIDLNTAGGSNGTLNIAGTNAARTTASDAAYTALIGRGWTITVN